MNDDEIREEIFIEALNEKEEGDKEKSNSAHLYTSSQTAGYDNSVAMYKLDFYDYVEDIEKPDK